MMYTRRRWQAMSEIAQTTRLSIFTAMRLYDRGIRTVAELRAARARLNGLAFLPPSDRAAIDRELGPDGPPPPAAA